jgi:co-chaperonin GroES (HSP10)
MKPYVFKYRSADPSKIVPIGDRYLIEVLETDETQLVAGVDMWMPDRSEQERGWAVGVVFAVGNGHRLETPDPVSVMPEGYQPQPGISDAEQMQRRISLLGYITPSMGDHSSLMRSLALVPMFYTVGDVIFIEKYSGREFVVNDRTFRFVSQVDTLGFSGVKLILGEDGWEDAPPPPPPSRLAAVGSNGHKIHRP